MKHLVILLTITGFLLSCQQDKAAPTTGFPFHLPKEKPDRKMSAAMERIYTDYAAPQPQNNELFSQFKYTELEGFDYNGHDGTISRRDPSKILRYNDKYYVWYTIAKPLPHPREQKNPMIPSPPLIGIWQRSGMPLLKMGLVGKSKV